MKIRKTEAVVLSGTLPALSKALDLAADGEQVILLENQTYLLPDIFSNGAMWINEEKLFNLNQDLCIFIKKYSKSIQSRKGLLFLDMDNLIISLEQLLENNGVKVLYSCFPTRIENNCVYFAHKSGEQVIKYQTVWDYRVSKFVSKKYYEGIIEFHPNDYLRGEVNIRVPKCFMLFNDQVEIIHNEFKEDISYLVYQFCLPKDKVKDEWDFMSQSKQQAWRLMQYLSKLFVDITFGAISDFLLGPFPEKTEKSLTQNFDVLVIGGGSSGAFAAIEAAKTGAHVALFDLNGGLGGTGTYGGVDSYWFGNDCGYTRELQVEVHKNEANIGYKGEKWLIEAKKKALQDLVNTYHVQVFPHTLVYDVSLQGQIISEICAVNNQATFKCSGEYVIDATGDGDIAALARVPFTYGSKRDHTVMWYSLPQYKTINQIQNNFTSMVCVGDVEDYTRAIISGRLRSGIQSIYKHGSYLAPRESRHILGDVTMTLTDQLLHRAWEDTIAIHFSNHDIKGVSDADWVNMGLISPNLEIEIPYRALLPQGINNLLVVGKAISVTHDGFPAIRMQADLENLGAISGFIVGQALKAHVSFREIDISRIQDQGVRKGILPKDFQKRILSKKKYEHLDLQNLVNRIEDFPLYNYAQMDMKRRFRAPIPFVEACMVGDKIIPLLERKLDVATGYQRIHLSQILAFYGVETGRKSLIEAIYNELDKVEGVPVRTADIWYATEPPDHGAMPHICYLLYTLSLFQRVNRQTIEVLEEIIKRLPDEEEAFKSKKIGLFYYMHSITRIAERQASPLFTPLLERLLKFTSMQSLVVTQGSQKDYFLERRAMIQLSLSRALARCGGRRGYELLIEYLEDNRVLLRMSAEDELQELTSLGFIDKIACLEWLKEKDNELPILPYTYKTDMDIDSEQIFRSEKIQWSDQYD